MVLLEVQCLAKSEACSLAPPISFDWSVRIPLPDIQYYTSINPYDLTHCSRITHIMSNKAALIVPAIKRHTSTVIVAHGLGDR